MKQMAQAELVEGRMMLRSLKSSATKKRRITADGLGTAVTAGGLGKEGGKRRSGFASDADDSSPVKKGAHQNSLSRRAAQPPSPNSSQPRESAKGAENIKH